MKYALEKFTDKGVMAEIRHISSIHLEEVGPHQFPLSIDWARYVEMESNGNIRLFTARSAGKIVGYATYLLSTHLHFKHVLFAAQDCIYLYPENRATGGKSFNKWIEEQLADCDVITASATPLFDRGPNLMKNGYIPLETTYMKILMEDA